MKKSYVTKFFYFVVLVFLFACNKSETPNPNGGGKTQAHITINAEKDIEETEFTASWSVNKTGISSINLQISSTEEFTDIIQDIAVPISSLTIKVSGLNGASTYYYKVIMNFSDNTSAISSTESVDTHFETEVVSFTTSDGLTLYGELAYLASNSGPKPAIIMMHSRGTNMNWWRYYELKNNTYLMKRLIAEGYVCLCFDFRGHGLSDFYERQKVLDNFGVLSDDLVAAIDFVKTHSKVDSTKLALIGADMGGMMAIAGNGYKEVKTSVALGAMREGINSIFPDFSINSAFFIAGIYDQRGTHDFKAEAEYLHSITHGPKKLTLVNSGYHGVALIDETLELVITDWINDQIDL